MRRKPEPARIFTKSGTFKPIDAVTPATALEGLRIAPSPSRLEFLEVVAVVNLLCEANDLLEAADPHSDLEQAQQMMAMGAKIAQTAFRRSALIGVMPFAQVTEKQQQPKE